MARIASAPATTPGGRAFRRGRSLPVVLAVACLAGAAGRTRAQTTPVISEFLTNNVDVLADEDGDFSDWIEIYNPLDAVVDMAGWSLTDNVTEPAKWVFPSVSIAPGQFLIVFASSKSRSEPDSELHTNFRLSSQGEFLALVDPGGRIASVFGPRYPAQLANTSYGIRMELEVEHPVDLGTAARYAVPTDDSLGDAWTRVDFDDAAWAQGPLGIGFDQKSTPSFLDFIQTDVSGVMRDVNATIYVRIPFDASDPDALPILRMRYEDGFVAYLNGEEIARDNTRDEIGWDARAFRSRAESAALLLAEIPLSTSAALRAGRNVLAIHGLNSSTSGNDAFFAPQLDLVRVLSADAGTSQYFTRPSPGQPNTDGRASVAPTPEISVPGHASSEPIVVSISVDGAGAEIRYTLDGTEPNEFSDLYTGALTITSTATLKAKSFQDGAVPSRTATEFYLPVQGTANLPDGTNLPVLILDLRGNPNESTYTTGTAVALEVPAGGRTRITDPFALATPAGVILHGSSSLGFAKKNMRLELRDESGQDEPAELFGLPSHSDFVLHGPYSDKSLMRNSLAYEWSNAIGRYAPRTQFVELYLKPTPTGALSASHYLGVYLVVERIKIDENRVNLDRVRPEHDSEPEISGGYIFKKDRADPGEPGFNTSRGYQLQYVEPKERELTPVQRSWINNWFREMETVLYGANFRDPDDGYAKYLDADSFIDHHILVEMCKNIDGYRLSTYMYKERNGKLNMGPVWDYNLSLGNANYLAGANPVGWYYPQVGASDYLWYTRLHQDPAYLARYRERWVMHRARALSTQNLFASVDRTADLIGEAQDRNFRRWRILGTYVWPNEFIASTWDEEIDWMRNFWLANRVEWMDSQFIQSPELSHPGGPVERGFQLEITSTDGPAYYTLNGGDPAGANAQPAPDAVLYTGPITIESNTRIRVRARIGELGWSGLVEASYVTDPLPLVVTEVMYNPLAPEGFRSTDLEFIELLNIGDEALDLRGVALDTPRLTFEFGAEVLAPGEYTLIVSDEEAFRAVYGDAPRVSGAYQGVLSNSSQELIFRGGLDEVFLQFTYDDGWVPSTDGDGYSLVIIDPFGPRSSWVDAASWRASSAIGGSPGRADGVVEPTGAQIAGDLTQDGDLNISDAVGTLRVLFGGADTSFPCSTQEGNLAVLDLTADSRIDLSDPVFLLNYLFLGGPEPVAGLSCRRVADCPSVCEP